jgi:hypothetical protein
MHGQAEIIAKETRNAGVYEMHAAEAAEGV